MTIALYHVSVMILVTANSLALIIGAFHAFKPRAPRYLQPLYIYLIITFLIDFQWLYNHSSPDSQVFPHASAPSLFHLYVITELAAFSYFLLHITYAGWAKKIALYILTLFVIACAYMSFLDRFQHFYPIAIITEIGVCLPLCLSFFHELFQNFAPSKNLLKDQTFWLVTGIFFYFASAIPLLIAMYWLDKLSINKFDPGLHAINNFALFITYLLFTKGYTCRTRKS